MSHDKLPYSLYLHLKKKDNCSVYLWEKEIYRILLIVVLVILSIIKLTKLDPQYNYEDKTDLQKITIIFVNECL